MIIGLDGQFSALAALLQVAGLASMLFFALTSWRAHSAFQAALQDLTNSRDLIDNLSEGIYRSALDGRQLSANKALVRLNGYESEHEMLSCVEDIGREWYVEPGRREEFRALLKAQGKVTDFVSEIYRHKTRERIWVTESARLVRHKRSGRPLYYEGSVQEITETVKRFQLEEQFKKLISEIPGALYQFTICDDESFEVNYLSPGFERLTGMDQETLRENATAFHSLVDERDRETMNQAIIESTNTLDPLDIEFRFDGPATGQRWFRMSATPERIGDRVTFHGYMSDISLRKKNEMAIERLAYYDSLTNLPNRRMFMERIAQAVERCSSAGSQGSVLFIDLDNFKTLNDSRGHDVGDRYLVQVAERLLNCVGNDDIVARIGGDEFVVILEHTGSSRADAARIGILTANRVLTALREEFRIGDAVHHSSASVGVVVFDGINETPEDIVRNADIAMYEAKAAGRDGMAMFDPARDAIPELGSPEPRQSVNFERLHKRRA